MRKPFQYREYRDATRPHLKFVVNYSEQGKRARRLFETKKAAQTFVDQKEIELLNKGKEGVEFPTALRVMSLECAERLAPYGKTLNDATDHLVAILKATAGSRPVDVVVKELIEAKRKDGASARYLSDLKSRLERFAMDFEGQTIGGITSAAIDDWLRGLPLSATSRNNFRRVVGVLCSFAVQRGYATANAIEKTSRAKTTSTPPGILAPEQTAKLLEVASFEILPVIAIGAFAGLRPAEIDRLEWRHVDFESGLIEVTAANSKTARRRLVKIEPNLSSWLAPYRVHKGHVAPANTRKLSEAAREAAGIKEWPHDALRHSFASYHLARFNDAAALALQMGHADTDLIFEAYRELVRPKVAEKFWQIIPSASASEKILHLASA